MKANEILERLLHEEGALAFGVTGAEAVEDSEWEKFEKWIARGDHAGMHYMENYPEIRRDPRLLLKGAKSIISIAYNYRSPNPLEGIVANYALGEDYHKVLRKRLKRVVRKMLEKFGGEWRICIDSAPILERYWAVKSGLGLRNAIHGNIMVEGAGSMVFLAEIITTLQLDPMVRNLMASRVCTGTTESDLIYSCPTGALQQGGTVNSRKCINYLTIEKKGEMTPEEKKLVGKAFFGCDRCLRKSPENMGEYPGTIPEFSPLPGLKEYIEGKTVDFPLSKSPLKRKDR